MGADRPRKLKRGQIPKSFGLHQILPLPLLFSLLPNSLPSPHIPLVLHNLHTEYYPPPIATTVQNEGKGEMLLNWLSTPDSMHPTALTPHTIP